MTDNKPMQGLSAYLRSEAMRFQGHPNALSQWAAEVDACQAMLDDRAQRVEEYKKFKLGDNVCKTKGSGWEGRVVGFYSTKLTPDGVAVESQAHLGSVQIYPATALETSEPVQRVENTQPTIEKPNVEAMREAINAVLINELTNLVGYDLYPDGTMYPVVNPHHEGEWCKFAEVLKIVIAMRKS